MTIPALALTGFALCFAFLLAAPPCRRPSATVSETMTSGEEGDGSGGNRPSAPPPVRQHERRVARRIPKVLAGVGRR